MKSLTSQPIFLILLISLLSFNVHAEIKVHCKGEGEAVYLIGGGPAFSSRNLTPVQDYLSQHYQVCRWDMRGVGENRSLQFSQKNALQQWLLDMAMLLPEKPVILWGHSWGALQALLFTKYYPHRVKTIVLNNPVDAALNSVQRIEYKRFRHPEVYARLTIDDMGTPAEDVHRFRSKIASYFLDPQQGWDYSRHFNFRDTNKQLNIQIWQEYKQQRLLDVDMQQLSRRIKGLIYCKMDVLLPENIVEYSRVLPQRKMVAINGCAHFPWEENPDSFFRALKQVLSS